LLFHDAELTGRLGFGAGGRAAEVLGSVVPTLFFVISGFLLYRPFVAARAEDRAGPAGRRYLRRRALRILPGYWVALTLLGIYPALHGVFTSDWWRYYGYLQLYSARTLGGGIAVAWTLGVEVTFYLALPIWAWGVRRLGRGSRPLPWSEALPLLLMAAAGVGVQLAAARQLVGYSVGISLAGQCTWLCLGMGLAVASVVAPDRSRRAVALASRWPWLPWGLAVAAFAALMAIVPAGGLLGLIGEVHARQPIGTTLARIALQAIAVCGLVLPAIFGRPEEGRVRRLLGARPLVALGVISYSFYLYHLTVSELIARGRQAGSFSSPGLDLLGHVHFMPTLILYVVTLSATLVVATVSYRVIELPFLRRKEAHAGEVGTSILPRR
jgi:peptidoglycan/LPS O-acetylase OafA/YrhL